MNKSNTIKELATAMAKAQAEMPHVNMNSVNPFLKSKFADLGAVIVTAKPVLQKHGISYSQMPYSEPGKVGITTIVMHTSGEWIESSVSLDLSDEKGKSAAQVAGSIITYLRRYSLASAFGMYADEDTDGTGPKKEEKKADHAPAASNNIVWTVAQKQALLAAKLADSDFAAKGMLGYSNLPADATTSEIVAWGTSYRTRRTAINSETGKVFTTIEAAAFANQAVGVSA